MTPYRGGPPAKKTRHAFGNEALRLFADAVGAVAFVIGLVLAGILVTRGGVRGEAFILVLFFPMPGLAILATARSGFIELRAQDREGVIVMRRFLSPERIRFSYGEIVGSDVEARPPGAPPADQEHVLVLRFAERKSVDVARAATAEALQARKTALDAFLAEQGLPER